MEQPQFFLYYITLNLFPPIFHSTICCVLEKNNNKLPRHWNSLFINLLSWHVLWREIPKVAPHPRSRRVLFVGETEIVPSPFRSVSPPLPPSLFVLKSTEMSHLSTSTTTSDLSSSSILSDSSSLSARRSISRRNLQPCRRWVSGRNLDPQHCCLLFPKLNCVFGVSWMINGVMVRTYFISATGSIRWCETLSVAIDICSIFS